MVENYLAGRRVCTIERVLSDAVSVVKADWGRHGQTVAEILGGLRWRKDHTRREHDGRKHTLWLAPGFDPKAADIPWEELGPLHVVGGKL